MRRLGLIFTSFVLLNIKCTINDSKEAVPPDCSLDSIPDKNIYNDPDTDLDNTNIFIPQSCEGTLFGIGITPDCAVETVGTLEIGDQAFSFAFACYTRVTVEDIITGTFFDGFFLTLITENGCDPMVGIFLSDLERDSDPPFSVNLDEKMCSMGERRRATIMIRYKPFCFTPTTPVEGVLSIDRNINGIVKGSFEIGNMYSIELGKVSIKGVFDMKFEAVSSSDFMNLSYRDLCSETISKVGF